LTNHHQPTRGEPRVALVTCTALPDLDPDDRLALAPLAARGIAAEAVVWDDPAVDWSGYDLVVLRSPWDYALRRDEFVAWARTVPTLVNPADVVAWNTDKTYLRELTEAGVPVVPTAWLAPGTPVDWPDWPEVVVKPTVSAGAQDTARYGPDEHGKARAHADRLLAAGRPVMVQPYLSGVDTAGESMLVHVGGGYSHGFRKEAILRAGESAETDALFRPEKVAARQPTPAEREVAARALAAVPGGPARLLYARVDLLPDEAGHPVVIELELTEPSLWLSSAPGAADRLAGAIRTIVRP
jgi:hypothetical protein